MIPMQNRKKNPKSAARYPLWRRAFLGWRKRRRQRNGRSENVTSRREENPSDPCERSLSISGIDPSNLLVLLGREPRASLPTPRKRQSQRLNPDLRKSQTTYYPPTQKHQMKRTNDRMNVRQGGLDGRMGTVPKGMGTEERPWFADSPHGVGTIDGIAWFTRYERGECPDECIGLRFPEGIFYEHYHWVEPPGLEDIIRAIGRREHKCAFRPSQTDRTRPYVVLCCMWCGKSIRGPRWRDNRVLPKVR